MCTNIQSLLVESYQKEELTPADDPLSPTLIPAYLNAGESVFKLINSRPTKVDEVIKLTEADPNTVKLFK